MEAMSSALCPEGQENWILSNKERQKTAESSKKQPRAHGLSTAESKQAVPSTLLGKHQNELQAY